MDSKRNLFGNKHSSSKPKRNADLAGLPPMSHINLSHPPSQTSSDLSHPLTVSQGLSGGLQMTDFDLIFILSIHLYPIRTLALPFPSQAEEHLPHPFLF